MFLNTGVCAKKTHGALVALRVFVSIRKRVSSPHLPVTLFRVLSGATLLGSRAVA